MSRRWLLCLNLAVCGFTGCNQYPVNAAQLQQTTIPAGDVGSRLPEFSMRDMKGREISSAELAGKVVLIDFWATWCQPCKKEMPGYQRLLERYVQRGFVVIGFKFSTMKDTEPPLAFAKSIGVHYPLVVATEKLTKKFGGIEGLPTTLLYDRHGILRKKIIGFEYTETFEAALKPLL